MTRIFGAPIRVHPLLWLVIIASALTGYVRELVVLFAVILIHELGHAAAANLFRWRVKVIRLLPFGGAAEVEESGNIPAWQETIVVLAGPLQNALMIVLALLCRETGLWSEVWAAYFIQVNMMIGLFNLLPIYPLDGGKLVHLILGMWLPYYQTLHVTYLIGLLLSSLMIAVSLGIWQTYGVDLNMLMIGIFLFMSNWVDYRNISYIFLRFLMSREARMSSWMAAGVTAQPLVVSNDHTVPQVVKMLRRERYHVIYVCNERGKIKQALSEQRLISAYLNRDQRQTRAQPFHFSYNKKKRSERRI